jgi:hypothetical protein
MNFDSASDDNTPANEPEAHADQFARHIIEVKERFLASTLGQTQQGQTEWRIQVGHEINQAMALQATKSSSSLTIPGIAEALIKIDGKGWSAQNLYFWCATDKAYTIEQQRDTPTSVLRTLLGCEPVVREFYRRGYHELHPSSHNVQDWITLNAYEKCHGDVSLLPLRPKRRRPAEDEKLLKLAQASAKEFSRSRTNFTVLDCPPGLDLVIHVPEQDASVYLRIVTNSLCVKSERSKLTKRLGSSKSGSRFGLLLIAAEQSWTLLVINDKGHGVTAPPAWLPTMTQLLGGLQRILSA